MSFSNDPYWPFLSQLATNFAGIPWIPSTTSVIQMFGHSLSIKELIDQISLWATYDFPTNPNAGWIECKAILKKLHEAFIISNYLIIKVGFSIIYNGQAYRDHKVKLEDFWEVANEQYKELTRLLKRAEQDTFKMLQQQQQQIKEPDDDDDDLLAAADEPETISLHQSGGFVGFEYMPTFSKLLAANYLFTGLTARVKALTEELQTVFMDPGDPSFPPPMNNEEFHKVLVKIAQSSNSNNTSVAAGKRPERRAPRAPARQAIHHHHHHHHHHSTTASQQSLDPVMGMSAMALDDPSIGPTEGEISRMLEYAEAESGPVPENVIAETRMVLKKVNRQKPVVVTPSERRLLRRRSYAGLIVDENDDFSEDDESE